MTLGRREENDEGASASATVDLVCMGNTVVDDVVYSDGRTRIEQAGGAALYQALAARLWGARVGVVSLAGSDYPPRMLEALARRSIDLRGLRSLEGPGAHSWLLYEPRGRRVVSRLGTPRHEDVSPGIEDIPAEYQGARAWLLGPMPIERQLDLTRHLASCAGRFVVVDPHVPLGAPTLDRWREVLTHADAFFVSHEELDLPGADTDPLGAFAAFGERLRFVGVKRAARGGTLIDRLEKKVMDWAPASEPVVDATGAGDAFAAGFAAGWLLSGGVEGALDRARISAAIAIENWGAHGFMGISPEMAALRLAGGGVSATPTRRGTRTAEPRRGSGAAR